MFGKKKHNSEKDRLAARMKGLASSANVEPPALFKNGALKLPNGDIISVVITALDATSARVEIATRQVLPDNVVLIEQSLKLRTQATVVWQREGAAALALRRDRGG